MSSAAPKPAADASAADPFAAAKANLRDTIKWLTTTFAAMAGIVLAGSTISGLGAVPPGWRLGVAVAGGLVGFLCTLAAIARVLRLLKSEAFFLGDVRSDAHLLAWLNAHAEDILPAEYSTAEQFLEAFRGARAEAKRTAHLDPPDAAVREAAVLRYKAFDDIAGRITSLLHFERMASRLSAEARPLMTLAAFAILGLAVFGWAASPPKPAPKAEPPACGCCAACAPTGPCR